MMVVIYPLTVEYPASLLQTQEQLPVAQLPARRLNVPVPLYDEQHAAAAACVGSQGKYVRDVLKKYTANHRLLSRSSGVP